MTEKEHGGERATGSEDPVFLFANGLMIPYQERQFFALVRTT